MTRRLAAALALALALAPAPAAPQEPPADPGPPPLIDYVVKPGESCDSIAARLFGDPKRVDILHRHNDLGQPPHKLAPGQVLRLPPPTSRAAGPDAKITSVRNQVEAYTPGQRPAGGGEALMRGHRVRTLGSSSAEVTFNDATRVQLGEHTLVVILGDTSSKAARSATSADTELLNGSLRAHLGALAGQKPQPLRLNTASGRIQIGGEAKVSVDAQSTTRLSAYGGTSLVSAAGKDVEVPAGYGTRVDKGKPPEAPRKLPSPPAWKAPPKVIGAKGLKVDMAADYGPGPGSGPVARWHVELARDEKFNDLVLDAGVPVKVTHFEGRELLPGEYWLRVSGLDADLLEGPPSEVLHFAVSPVRLKETGPLTAEIGVPPGLFCGVDGAPLAAADKPFTIRRTRPRKLRCATKQSGEGAVETTLPPAKLGKLVAKAELLRGQKPREGKVTVTFTDAAGAAMEELAPEVAEAEGATVEALEEEKPGIYTAKVTWAPGTRAMVLAFTVPGADEATPVEIVVNEPAAPAKADATAPEPERVPEGKAATKLEVALLGGGALGGDAAGLRGALEIGVEQRLGGRFTLGAALRPGYERHLGDADREVFLVGLPVGLRLRAPDAWIFPYVAAMPELLLDRAPDGAGGTASEVGFAVGGLLGGQVKLGPVGVFVEAAGRAGLGERPLPFLTLSAGARMAVLPWE